MRVPPAIAAAAVALLFQGGAQADNLAEQVAKARAVVLVQVAESSYPPPDAAPAYYLRAIDSTARLLVVRSWKGPYPAGATINAETQKICGRLCSPYPFQVGQQVLVFVFDAAEPIHALRTSVVDGVHVAEVMKKLDSHAAKVGP